MPSGTEVLTGDAITKEQQADTRKQMGFITTFLMVFADIAMLVGAFIICNTFSIIVAQRSREMALLRAIGASRKQVLRSVLAEAAVVGLFASVVGLFAGLGVAAGIKGLFGAIGFEIPGGPVVVTTKTVVMALVTGIGRHGRLGLAPRSSWIEGRAGRGHARTGRRGGPRLEATDRLRPRHHGVSALPLLVGLPRVAPASRSCSSAPSLVFVGIAVLGPLLARPAVRVIGAPLPPAGHHRLTGP